MRESFRRSRKGLDTIVAEVLMLLIIIIMSSIVFIWVVPTFQSSTVGGNSGATYSEKFSTLWGQFATFAPSNPETITTCDTNGFQNHIGCSLNSPLVCPPSPIVIATSQSVYVPPNSICVIKANVGNVVVNYGSNLTVIGAVIHGDLMANYSASVTLQNAQVYGFTGLYNVGDVSITGSSLNTSGANHCTDACGGAMYDGGRGLFQFVNNTVTGQVESEVSHQAIVTGNTVSMRLEIESADFGQISNNKVGMLDLDQNGIVVVSGNTVYANDPYYPGVGILWGNPPWFNRWCAQSNNVVSGSNNMALCVGNVEIDIINTGNIPVNLVATYMSNVPLSGPVTWKLLSGGAIHNALPITIPVGQGANVTMQWTPPINLGTLPWTDIYFVFVSSHGNFVDGHVYFGYNPALTVTSQSRPQNRVCPPCY